MVSPPWISAQMPCRIWLLVFSYSLRIAPSSSELEFSNPPKDGVGILNSPLMLHCSVYDSGHQKVLPVTWEKDNGTLSAGVRQMANGSLFFPKLQEEDLGGYICSSKKGSKQIRTIVRVSKAYLENVFFSPQSQRADEGQDVFLQCVSGESSPPVQISWLKNGRAFTKGTQIQGQYGGGSQGKTSGTLHLVNITKADQGLYVCITHNPLLNISKVSGGATLTVHGFGGDLKITHDNQNVTVPVEMKAAFHCVVQGFPAPIVQWFKDDQMLPNTSRWDLQDDGQLLVNEKVLPEDEGFYYCEANNDQERVRSQPAYLLPAVMDWTFILQPTNKTVTKGESVTLSCRPPHSRPPAQVSWFRNSRLLRPRPHFTLEPTGDLLFLSVQETDRGSYFCRASNPYLKRAITSRKVYLEVLAPPSVTIWPLAVTSTLEAEVVFQCQVSGHPVPSIEWSKQGRSVRTGGKVNTGLRNATLFISSVRIFDEGLYTCAASNSVGQDKKTATLRIAAKPVIVSFLGSVNVSEGASVILPCRAVGNTPMKYNWGRPDLQTILLITPRVHIDNNGTLHISDAHQSDAGEYYCTAENNFGQDSRKAFLKVLPDEQEEDVSSAVPEMLPEESTQPAIYSLELSKDKQELTHQSYNTTTEDVYVNDSPTYSKSTYTPFITYTYFASLEAMNTDKKQQDKDILKTAEPWPTNVIGPYTKPHESHTEKSPPYTTPTYPVTEHPGAPTTGLDKKNTETWWPVLEKHDIPIVVGVGISLAFIFITMAFYSLFRKNDPAAIPAGRGALRGLGGPCRHGERLAVERTYDNKAFEDDNMVAVIEQSPNTSETRAHPLPPSPSTLLMEPFCDDVQDEIEPVHDLPVIVETHPEPCEEEQLETSFEEGKITPSPQSDIQLRCVEDWKSRDNGQCEDAPSSSPPKPPAAHEEGLRSSLTLQTGEACSTPVCHSISISHGSSPLLLSHCVSLGMTSVAVDVQFYPSGSSRVGPPPSGGFGMPGPRATAKVEHEQMAPTANCGK